LHTGTRDLIFIPFRVCPVGVNVTVVLRGHFVHHVTSRLKFRECLLFENLSMYAKSVSACP
jgi:hypothetical protein